MIGMTITSGSLEGVAFFLGAYAVRAAAVLAAAVLLCVTLRKASAAARHTVLAAALVGVLLLPAITVLAPPFSLAVLPEASQPEAVMPVVEESAEAAPPVAEFTEEPLAFTDARESTAASTGSATPEVRPIRQTERGIMRFSWPLYVLIAWACGVVFLLSPTLAGLVAIARKARRSTPVTDREWMRLLDEARQRLGVHRKVRLLQSSQPEIPTTWGILRSVILLPSDATDWPEERRRVVLLHELAHIKRHDFATQLLAYVVRALHWLDPFAWLAVRALRLESECACDDLLVTVGASKPSDYARHLIDMVRTLRPASSTTFVAIAMARRTRLEARVRALLDKRLRRGMVTYRMLATTLVVAFSVCGILAIVHPVARALAEDEGNGVAKATLPCGAKIELLAVRKHRSDDATFWRPNGTPMKEMLYGSIPDQVSGQDCVAYEFSFFITELPEGAACWSAKFPYEGASAARSGASLDLRDAPDLHIESVCLPSDAEVTTMTFRVSDGKWREIGRPFGGASGGVAGSQGFDNYSLAYGSPYVEAEEVRIAVTDNVLARYPRVVAVDRFGGRHPSASRCSVGDATSYRMGTYSFDDVALDQVKEFRFETCGYETVEFRNVSLVKGERTNVEVVVEPGTQAGVGRGGLEQAPPPAGPAGMGGGIAVRERENSSSAGGNSASQCLKYFGLVFKMFANESRGQVFPVKSAKKDVFLPELSELVPVFLNPDTPDGKEQLAYLQGQGGADLCYFGHVVTNEEEAMALLDAYEQEGLEDFRNVNITVAVPGQPGELYQIHRLREGIERFFIKDINDSAASALTQSKIPVLWEMPDSPERKGKGGHVLYMDGHVERKDYPGEFPMTETFVKRMREIMTTPKEKRTIQAGKVEVTLLKKQSPTEQRRQEAAREVSAILDKFTQAGWNADEYAKYAASLSESARERENAAIDYLLNRSLGRAREMDARRGAKETQRLGQAAHVRRSPGGEQGRLAIDPFAGEEVQDYAPIEAMALFPPYGPRVRLGTDGTVFLAFGDEQENWANVALGQEYEGLRLDKLMQDSVSLTDLTTGKQFDAFTDDRIAGMRAAEVLRRISKKEAAAQNG